MARVLPLKYNLLLFVALALLYPVAGFLVGEPFTEPTITELLVLPLVIVVFGNLGYYFRSRRADSGVVDERDVRNIDLAFAGTGAVLLVSIVAIYARSALTAGTVPAELDYLALVGVATIVIVLGGSELYQRI